MAMVRSGGLRVRIGGGLLWALLLAVVSGTAGAQETVDLAVSVRSRSGRVLGLDAAASLRALEAGQPGGSLEVLAEAEAIPRRTVIYLDLASTRRESMQRIVGSLLDQVDALSGLPGLEIVRADPTPRTLVGPGATSEELNAVLSALFVLESDGADEVSTLRRDFLERQATRQEVPGVLRRVAIELELELRRRQQDALLLWLADQGFSDGPRLLILTNDDLGLQLASFYGDDPASGDDAVLTRAQGGAVRLAEATGLATALATYGWTTVPLVVNIEKTEGRLRYLPTAETPVGFRLSLGGRRNRLKSAEEIDLRLAERDLELVEVLARQTGGEVLVELTGLIDWVSAFSERSVVRYRPLQRVTLGEARAFELIADRERFEVLAPAFIGSGTPEAVAEARARLAIDGATTDAELPIRSAIEFDSERLGEELSRFEVRVDLFDLRQELSELGSGSFRVTLGVHLENGELLLRHEVASNVALAEATEWRYEGTLRLPRGTDGTVVLVELLDTGDWGESFASFVDRRSSDTVSESQADVGGAARIVPQPRAIRLIPPVSEVQLGRVSVRTETDESVERVIFFLDGKKVDTRRRLPFTGTFSVGSVPRQRSLVAVAYDRQGAEVGRDALPLNEVAQSFYIRITEPGPGDRVGPVEVVAELKLPDGSPLDRVDFYWQEELAGSVRRSPYRHRLLIPVSAEPGYIRVAAHLTDGRTAEDIVLMNADQFEDELTVRLVELYVVVTDRSGKPVLGLKEKDFTITEDGEDQEIESFEVAGRLPITIGLAIDSSLSLFLRMASVRRAAGNFVNGLVRGTDRAFLVGFGSSPQLVRATTGDLGNVMEGIDSLKPGGTTALWEAMVLSLEQLRQSSGRKALVVFYDGDDEDEDFSFGTSFNLARQSGVPIYLIVMNNAAARSQGTSFGTKSRAGRLEQLARTGGGRVFYVRTDQDLGEIFAVIRNELRSHYLLTYYGRRDSTELGWRPIEVAVEGRGLSARTLSGYGDLLLDPGP